MTVIEGLQRSVVDLTRVVNDAVEPTAEQRQIIGAAERPTLVVAGAGSGKTETLSMRMVYLLDHAERWFGEHISPDRILCLTFTTKAAAEIEGRAQRRLDAVFGVDPDRPPPTVMTYNAYGAQLLSEHGLRVGIDPDSAIATDATLWQVAMRVTDDWPEDVDSPAALSTIVSTVPLLSGQLREHGQTPADLKRWVSDVQSHLSTLPRRAGEEPSPMTATLAGRLTVLPTLSALADLVEAYDRGRRDRGVIDYSDQIASALALSRLSSVQSSERSRYAAVLLDEFQDTSPAQLALFVSMFGPDHCVMAVGDPHQAIYGFRGASAQALTDFVDAYGGASHVPQLSLSVSWRNSTRILEAANAAVEPLRSQATVAVDQLVSAHSVTGKPEPLLKHPAVTSIMAEDTVAEAAAVVAGLVERRAELAAQLDADRPVTAAVLCRKKAQFAAVIAACESAGVEYEVVGLGGLLDHPDVADVLALLEAAHNPARADSLMRILTSERVALGPHDLMALRDWASAVAQREGDVLRETTIVDVLSDLPDPAWESSAGRRLSEAARERLGWVATMLERIRRHTHLPVPELLMWTHRAWGLDIEETLRECDGGSLRPMDALVDAAHGFVATADTATLGAFLAWVETARSRESGLDMPVSPPRDTAVQVLTVHAAKGLEWDVVAIAGMVERTFPWVPYTDGEPRDTGWMTTTAGIPWELRMDSSRLPQWRWRDAHSHDELSASMDAFRAAAGIHAVEEERRLFYVALTRARSAVLLTGAWRGTSVKPMTESVFVRELLDAGVISDQQWAPRPPADERIEPLTLPPATWPPPPSAAQVQRRHDAAQTRAALATAQDAYDHPLPWAREIAAMMQDRREREARRLTVAAPTHVSTSAMVVLREDTPAFVESVRRPMPNPPRPAATHGSAVHAWIERHYGHATLVPDEWFDESRDPQIDAAIATFESSPWASKTPIAVEVAIDMPVAGVVVRSRIDAVFPPDQTLPRTTVVDWKSGRPPNSPEQRAAREVQLAIYRLAWATMTSVPVEDVDAAFYYVAEDVTVYPASLLDAAALEAMIREAYASSDKA